MKHVIVTEHAILRRYQRFHTSVDDMDADCLKNEILSDFQDANLIEMQQHGANLYVNDNSIYVVREDKLQVIILTTYPKSEEYFVKKHIINNENVFIETTEILDKDVINCLKNNDIVILKHFGNKKLVSIGDSLIMLKEEHQNTRTIFHIIETWDVRRLNSDYTLNNFKNNLFTYSNRIEWEEFLVKLNLYKTVYNYKKYTKESEVYIDEIQTYKRVLIGELEDFPADFWKNNKEVTIKLCVKYLIQEVLEWSYLDVINNFDSHTLQKYKLGEIAKVLFNGDCFLALDITFPKKYKRYSFKKLSKLN